MKNRNLILSVLFWALASLSMAVTLPSTSYSSFALDDDATAYTISTGTTFMNHSLTASASNAYEQCPPGDDPTYTADGRTTCWSCCSSAVSSTDPTNPDIIACMGYCQGTHLGSLEGSTVFFLSIMLAYGALMVYRHKKAKTTEGIAL